MNGQSPRYIEAGDGEKLQGKHIERFRFRFSKVQRPTRHIIGHFGDESSQAINCTGTDNKKLTN